MTDFSPDAGLAGLRAASVAPPPLPAIPVEEVEKKKQQRPTKSKPVAAKTPKKAQPKKAKAKPADDSDTGIGVGTKAGEQYQVAVQISTEAKDILDERVERNGTTQGEEAIQVISQIAAELRDSAAARADNSNGFAPPRQTMRRLHAESKANATLLLTGPEADALQQLKEDTNLSYPLILDTALRRSVE